MSFVACGFAGVMRQCGGKQAEAGRSSFYCGLPSGEQKTVVELESQAGNALGVRKIRIKVVRPQLHAARGKLLNLFALWQGGSPDLPKRIFSYHFRAIALDALGSLGDDFFMPTLARRFVGKNMTGNGGRPEDIEVVDFAE